MFAIKTGFIHFISFSCSGLVFFQILFVIFFHLSLFKAIMTGKTKKIQKCFFLQRIINNFAETMQVSRLMR